VEPFRLFFAPQFITELAEWRRVDPKIVARIDKLIEDTARDPFRGIGKPEHLKYLEPNLWARRITDEHRLVYLVDQGRISFLQCRYHYSAY
jgi:toxin YoeB